MLFFIENLRWLMFWSCDRTLQTLLNQGFEPNERIEGIAGRGPAFKNFSCYWGFTPLQILTLAAADARTLRSQRQESREGDTEATRILNNTMAMIRASADLLLKNGARVNLPPPPPTRLDRAVPAGCYSLEEALKDQQDPALQHGGREGLHMDRHVQLLALLGSPGGVASLQKAFATLGKTVEAAGAIVVDASPPDSEAPGGSNSGSCAICWSEFGIISNRKHLCRVSRRYVCNECSSKRLVANGKEHRVSDGVWIQFLADSKRADAIVAAGREEKRLQQRRAVTQARQSLGLNAATTDAKEAEERKGPLSTTEKITNALGQTRNAVLERGNKLESLADKSEALNRASLDFANMAKELNQSQSSWW